MTAPLTAERLAEIRARAEAAHFGGSASDTIDLSDDAFDLMAEVERLTERAERAEGALARAEALSWSLSPADGPRVREAMGGKP